MKKLQSRYLFDRCVLLILALGILALLLLVALTVYIAEEPLGNLGCTGRRRTFGRRNLFWLPVGLSSLP